LTQHVAEKSSRLAPWARSFTTALCCAWGYSFAYSFFRCIQDRSGLLVCMAAVLPLAAVWAALERKRWGRLVLIGQSLLAQALFAIMLSTLACSHPAWIDPTERHFLGYVRHTLHLFGETRATTMGILLLSAASSVWFCMPWVRREFESRKKPFLTPGQRLIAVTVVSVWCVTMVASPTRPESRSPDMPLKAARRLTLRY
jgi:hypothetical protein